MTAHGIFVPGMNAALAQEVMRPGFILSSANMILMILKPREVYLNFKL